VHGGAHERLARKLRERAERLQGRARERPLLQLGLDGARRGERVAERLAFVGAPSQRRQRLVAGDREQPRLDVPDLGAGTQRRPRLQQSLLHDVLAAAVGKQAAAVREQRPAMAQDDRLKRDIRAAGGERRKPSVGLGPQDRERDHRTSSFAVPRRINVRAGAGLNRP
jgi:hypothetical protein